jgi:toxin YoeB
VSWRLVFTKQAKKDAKRISQSGLKPQADRLPDLLREDPYLNPPPYEKLVGDLSGACSRRINIQHRLIYQVIDDIKTVKVIRILFSRYFSDCTHSGYKFIFNPARIPIFALLQSRKDSRLIFPF